MSAENLNNVKLKVTDLSKRYKEPPVQALKDINFEVNDGDFFLHHRPLGMRQINYPAFNCRL